MPVSYYGGFCVFLLFDQIRVISRMQQTYHMRQYILWLMVALSSTLCYLRADESEVDELEKGWTKLNNEYVTAIYAARAYEMPSNFNRTNVPDDILGGNAPAEISFKAELTDKCVNHQWVISGADDLSQPYYTTDDTDWTFTFNNPGVSYVGLYAWGDDTDMPTHPVHSYTITITDSYLGCPNAFSPNGDGVNDEWKVSYRSLREYECHIFNRWGKEMFSSRDPEQGWDGKAGGKTVPAGVYYYVITATGNDGQQYKLGGDINILQFK